MTEIEKIDRQIKEIMEKLNDPKLCDGSAATYSRISGYYRPVENWNNGKTEEFIQRLEYSFNNAITK
jgi:anaerobic ribonucleoside-triphosphate reductase